MNTKLNALLSVSAMGALAMITSACGSSGGGTTVIRTGGGGYCCTTGGGSSGSSGSSGTSGSSGSSGSSSSTSGSSGSSGSSSSTSGSSGSSGSSSSASGSSGSGGYSLGSSTKDGDLQRAQVEQQDLQDRASQVATQFSMNFSSAVQLTQLADTMAQLQAAGKFTGEDQLAVAQSALQVAGISYHDYTAAMTDYVKNGNKNAFNPLITQGASNLGMPSSAALRDQILPSLGINVNNL